MEFGITIPREGLANQPEPLKHIGEFARSAESLGWSYLVLGDRIESGLDTLNILQPWQPSRSGSSWLLPSWFCSRVQAKALPFRCHRVRWGDPSQQDDRTSRSKTMLVESGFSAPVSHMGETPTGALKPLTASILVAAVAIKETKRSLRAHHTPLDHGRAHRST
jgi:hypothetical protein